MRTETMKSFVSQINKRLFIIAASFAPATMFAFLHTLVQSSFESLFFVVSAYFFVFFDMTFVWKEQQQQTNPHIHFFAALAQECALRIMALIIPLTLLFIFAPSPLAIGVTCTYLFSGFLRIYFLNHRVQTIHANKQ